MYKYSKRFFDFITSLIVLILLSPLLIPIAIGLKLTGEGYVFYFQKRVGFKNKVFDIWKFATMLKDSPNMAGGIITTKKDPRITPMGGFLRKSKINELPQIINILKGDMSIVGPRPVMPKSFNQYPDDVKKVIYNVKPGLTGVGSIIFRDEEDIVTIAKERGEDPWDIYKNEIYPYKGEVEKWYQKNQSFTLDFFIIFCTAWVILFPDSNLLYNTYKSIPQKPASLILEYNKVHAK